MSKKPNKNGKKGINFNLAFARLQFGVKKRGKIYEKIASFSKQSVPLFDTISMFEEAYGRKSGDARAVILKDWRESMESGASFSEAIRETVPEAETMLIAAGEEKGDIEYGMKKAVFITNSIFNIRKTLIFGLASSAVLLSTLLGMMYMFSVKVIPEMTSVLPVEEWPDLSKSLYSSAMAVKNYGAITLGAFVVFLATSIYTLGFFTGPVRSFLDKIPPWSIYKTIQGSVFLITLSSLMSAGIPIKTALQKIYELSPPYIKKFIEQMIINLSHGLDNGESLNVGLMDKDTELDIELLGRTADFRASMLMIGEDSVGATVEKLKASTVVVSTAILFLVAGFVIFVYTGFFELTQAITDNASSMK